MRHACFGLLLAVSVVCPPRLWAQDAKPSIAERLRAATGAIQANPRDKEAYRARAALYAAAAEHALAIADYDRLIELDPQSADAYDQRGSQHFMLGHIGESIDDFDRFLKLRPQQEPWH